MARWLVILGLAVAPCIDTAAAAKPKAATAATSKVRRKPVPAAARAAAAPLNVAVTDPPVSDPTAGGRVAAADAGPHAAGPDAAGADAAVRRDAGPATPGGCAAGDRRTVSTYYSEGRKTASGAAFDRHAMTAAHRTLPFGTQLTVSNPLNGRSVTVVVNDRGPFVAGIGLDLSLGAAQVIGMRGRAALCVR